ncbi:MULTISPECIES: hypothetical protein [Micromonospora]|uniref:Lipoprotein n=1 Tax=Micromonospora solifontis TaxID=2487138 RepID=A0ABX9WKL9_9ACTN|nr:MULTISPECIES: hypothetical protein [Micromonospora]NES14787.1 hypothetical protein [Micromonospora sp. PPF5-17B]NES35351.1 hypothetical protein [Micromonospora solifontis]NES56167.1 hypothetical protein [Micromonospora sp. PPF5-6]RNM00848.1 hypothetical protein EFE23_04130 [Micromonospora solifontis]
MSTTSALRAATLVTLTALAGACQSTGEDSAAPVGSPTAAPSVTSAEPGPTTAEPPTAANTAAVCAEVDKLIIAKSREIAADSAAAARKQLTPEQINAQVKADLADLADDVRGQAAKAADPEIKALVTETAQKIDAGAKSASPVKWLSSTFVAIPQRLTRECRA